MSDPAENLLVVNARVLTMDEEAPRAEAVAIRAGRIAAVGDRATAAAAAAPGSRVIDAAGASVVPGFVEAHMHLFAGAAELDHLSLAGVSGFETMAAAIRAYAAANPHRGFLMAQSADYAILSPGEPVTRHHLDRIIPDRPFAMVAPDHHTMWANTRALEVTGLLNGRSVGPGNEVVMGADGLAEGELREFEAFQPVIEASGGARARLGLATGGEPVPYPATGEVAADLDILRAGLAHAARHGITSIHNMDGNRYTLELLDGLRRRGELTARVRVPFHFRNHMDLSELARAAEMTRSFADDWLASGFVKMFYDGVVDSQTAVMAAPYADRPDWCGEPLFSPARFAEIATAIDRMGLQIAVHAIGDGAVHAVLDGYEAARRTNGARDSRHRIEHLEVVLPGDIARFAALGVLASVQPSHPPGAMDFPLEPTLSRIGPDRWPYAYAYRAVRDAGARMPFASDWPVSPIDPLRSIRAAMTRKAYAPGLSDNRFTLLEAIAGYTVEGAHAGFRDHSLGRLKPGFHGDLVVLSADLEALAPEAIDHARPVATVTAGRVVYSA